MLKSLKACFFLKNLFCKRTKLLLKSILKRNHYLSEGKKCLLLAPHPDDESIGAGGTLALYTEKFSVACLTNGNKGIRETLPQQAELIREQELRSVMDLMKVPEVFWLNIDDNHLMGGTMYLNS